MTATTTDSLVGGIHRLYAVLEGVTLTREDWATIDYLARNGVSVYVGLFEKLSFEGRPVGGLRDALCDAELTADECAVVDRTIAAGMERAFLDLAVKVARQSA